MSSNKPEARLAKRTNDTFATSSALANLSAIPSQAESVSAALLRARLQTRMGVPKATAQTRGAMKNLHIELKMVLSIGDLKGDPPCFRLLATCA
jgi:hypothetical protein